MKNSNDSSFAQQTELLHKLNNIGIRLSAEHNTDALIALILDECMKITNSDGGSVYIKEEDEESAWIIFKHTRNTSRDFPFNEFALPINKSSFAGYCALTGETLSFSNMEETEKLIGIKHNDIFDQKNHYCTKNMLVIPMKNYEDEVIGVMQLINKKDDFDLMLSCGEDYDTHLVPYTIEEQEIITSLVSQAAILIERTILYEEIESLFRSFIESLVMALDKRDPVTAGHSKRVADYAVALAEAVTEFPCGMYKNTIFDQNQIKKLYYAGLLHDIGKVGVEEYLLQKETRLSYDRIDAIRYRFNYIQSNLKLQQIQTTITAQEAYLLENLNPWFEQIEAINKKGFVTEEEISFIEDVASIAYVEIDGSHGTLLDPKERECLCIPKGNLTTAERRKIEAHPQMTYEVLHDIAWGKALKDVPKIASAHHEKLNGDGYPEGLHTDEIPLMSKILTIVDIFDALTAKDRPYKCSVSMEQTLKVLRSEVRAEHIDPELTEIFICTEAYKKVLEREQEPENLYEGEL